MLPTKANTSVYHLAMRYESFLGSIKSMCVSNLGYASNSLARMPFCTDDLSCCIDEILSFSSNLIKHKYINAACYLL